jgi:hypothetical protein
MSGIHDMEETLDGRSSIVEPTRRGQSMTNAAFAKVEEIDDAFFARVKALAAFHAALVALVDGEEDA